MANFFILQFFIFYALYVAVSGALSESSKVEILDKIFNGYDNRILPKTDGKPVIVTTNMFVRSIPKVDSKNMEFSTQLTFRLKWSDLRLRFNDTDIKYINLDSIEKLWKPDIFFSNELKGNWHTIMQPNALVRIYQTGQILYSSRISLVLSCPMNLNYYPFDRQNCAIRFGSYGHTTEDIVLLWEGNDPIQVTKTLNLPGFILKQFQSDYATSRTLTGEYSALVAVFLFEREFFTHFLQCFLPCAMFVLMSWLHFWLNVRDIVARVLISLSSLVTLSIGIGHLNVHMPHVSYVKAIDVWTGVCLTFVFASLIELIVVARLYAQQPAGKQSNPCEEAAKELNESSRHHIGLWKRVQTCLQQNESNKVDVICRALFPLAFLLFVIMYTIMYSCR